MNRQTKRVLMLGTALVPFVLVISTAMAIKGLSVGSAHYYEMEQSAGEWQIYATSNLSDPAAPQAVIDTLAPLEDSVCHIAGLEESEGIVSGSPGKGALSAALVSACRSVSSIGRTLEETRDRTEERQAKIAAMLHKLQSIPEEKNIPIFERRNLFRDQVGLVRQESSGGSADDLHEKVSAQVAVLRASVIALETKDGKFGERQRAAIASLTSQLANVEFIVNAFLSNTASESLIEPAELASSGAAIRRWWPRLTPQIVLALGVDLSILWIAGFLAVSRARLRALKDEL